MKQLRVIYAMVMAVIYVTATAMSSLSILCCDHDHLHHAPQSEEHSSCCHCHHTAEAEMAFGCGHQHIVLGDHHTEFIVVGERSDARHNDIVTQIRDYGIVAACDNSLTPVYQELTPTNIGYEAVPLRAAFISHESLRAPPSQA